MTKVYHTRSGSQYFFAQGTLVKVVGDGAERAQEPKVLYTTTAEINAALADYDVSPNQTNEEDVLQPFFEALKQKEISRDILGGRFISLGTGDKVGRVLFTGEVIESSERTDLEGRLPALGFT